MVCFHALILEANCVPKCFIFFLFLKLTYSPPIQLTEFIFCDSFSSLSEEFFSFSSQLCFIIPPPSNNERETERKIQFTFPCVLTTVALFLSRAESIDSFIPNSNVSNSWLFVLLSSSVTEYKHKDEVCNIAGFCLLFIRLMDHCIVLPTLLQFNLDTNSFQITQNGAMNCLPRVVQIRRVIIDYLSFSNGTQIILGITYCFLGACCAGRLHERTGENFFSCIVPGATQGLRTKIRMAYGIKVSTYRRVFPLQRKCSLVLFYRVL